MDARDLRVFSHGAVHRAGPLAVAAALVAHPVTLVHFTVAPSPHSAPLALPCISNNASLVYPRPIAVNYASASAAPRVTLPQSAHHAAVPQRQQPTAVSFPLEPLPLPAPQR